MKFCHVIGARPQFVKYFAVMQAEADFTESSGMQIEDVLIHTGQHYSYNMSKIFFDELGIKEPNHHLGVGSGSHAEQTGQLLVKTERVLLQERPDVVVLYGDTNSTLGGALAAAKLGLPIAHVEAGLRSFNRSMPEEINRVLTDHLSSILFCPSLVAVENLEKEGFRRLAEAGRLISFDALRSDPEVASAHADDPLVVNSGDVMYDVLLHAVKPGARHDDVLQDMHLESKSYVLLTIHRAENTDDPRRMSTLVTFINEATACRTVILPMHPRMRKVYEQSSDRFAGNVRIIEPVGYFDMLILLKNSAQLMTDSGGMQKEAFWLKVPCVTLRDETEWTETVASGWNVLYRNYLGHHSPPSGCENHYGDGKAATRIVMVLARILNSRHLPSEQQAHDSR